MSNAKIIRPRWPFLIKWIIATEIALFAGGFLGLAGRHFAWSVLRRTLYTPHYYWLYQTITTLIVGLFLGAAQWLVIRRYARGAVWWIACTAVGLALGRFASPFIGQGWQPFTTVEVFTGIAFFGLIASICQWMFLRSWIRHAAWWIPTSVAACVMGGLIMHVFYREPGILALSALISAGIVYGAVTGIVLMWLYRINAVGWKRGITSNHTA